ncbi:sugar ABC transporter permease [Rhodobacterales bacterium 59_46_T64]|nr:sugar ABC transporter permease [Rhodobacterales bacterium 59_46_T64]
MTEAALNSRSDPAQPQSNAPIPPVVRPVAGSAALPARAIGWTSARAVLALMLREMGSRYGRTPGGYVWAVLEPLGYVVILSLAFSLLFRSPSLGTSFVLFYATGYLPFIQYQNVSHEVARSLRFSRALMSYPVVSWIDAVLARFILNALTTLFVAVLLMTLILSFVDTRGLLDFGPILLAFALASLGGLGVGLVNCALIGLVPVWEQLWNIISRPLFLGSAILYTFEDLPTMVSDFLWFNPLVHVSGLMRRGVYSTYDASYVSLIYTFGVAMILVAFGLLLMRRFSRKILNDM